ncbi:glycosyltransferase [Akkermansia sp.]|uniref:glycosyltransferase n=1 Tax=Akkermansia sp. TaxID=1872421 RepID=UPI0025BCEEAE|nr:glycosyltransferase [Akkermansia sp.]MCC8149667.1 glycosyltransferase [Akkermansia sp.]
MNICITNTRECNPFIGGVESVSHLLAQALTERGHRVIFVADSRAGKEARYVPAAESFFLPEGGHPESLRNVSFLADLIRQQAIDVVLNQAANIGPFSRLWDEVKKRTDIRLVSAIHFAPLYNIQAAAANFFILPVLGRNPVRWCRNILLWLRFHLYQKKKMKRAEASFYRERYRNSDAVVMLSEAYKPAFVEMTGDTSRLHVIGNPVRKHHCVFNREEKKHQLLYVGRLEYGLKRVDRLLSIWKELYRDFPSWELVVVGDGAIRPELEKMVERQQMERVSFAGFRHPGEYLKESSILCLTSSSEGFGMVLVEALQHGCVPVAYDSFGALHDIMEDGITGYAVPPFRKKEFIHRLRTLMSDEGKREEMARAGTRSCDRHNIDYIVRQWEKLFIQVIYEGSINRQQF